MSNFIDFSQAVQARFDYMAETGRLYVVNIDKDLLWETYLSSFPAGTNEIFRKRTEHDCSCCRQFIKNVGNVIHVDTLGNIGTIWQGAHTHPYDVVAAAMDRLVRAARISDIFLTTEKKIGTAYNYEQTAEGPVLKWDHFHCEVPLPFRALMPDAKRGEIRNLVAVIARSLEELSLDAVDTVIELIDENQLYRGAQYKNQLVAFKNAKLDQLDSFPGDETLYAWVNYKSPGLAIRNTAIGTLLVDLSEGMAVPDAVLRFEQKVAPTNYRRSTAPISKGMVEKAVEKVREMGLESALERRHAVPSDVSINAVLWANRSTKGLMKDQLLDSLMAEVSGNKQWAAKSAEELTMNQFLEQVLPSASKLEVLFDNDKVSNLMSVTAPVHDDAGRLFSWDNGFSWSYKGNVADSIKERVKRAGGDVNGMMRVSLSWNNYDDLDIHLDEGGEHIYYHNKSSDSAYGGLDVDMNAGGLRSRTPVENLTWHKVGNKKHKIWVHNYTKRETTGVGFTVEIAIKGQPSRFLNYPFAVKGGEKIKVAEINVVKAAFGQDFQITVGKKMQEGSIELVEYGLTTGMFQEVNMVMLSPNYWEGQSGNKHWFFIIDNCKTEEPIRGIYNEFLRSELVPHRKVFETLANKTMCAPAEQQLSGLGFSETIPNQLVIRVDGGRQYKVSI